MKSTVDQIRSRIQELNAAWLEGRPEDLVHFFDPDVVLVAPGFQQRLAGREACIQSYRDFIAEAKIHDFRAEEPAIDVIGRIAVATCPYAIAYTIGENRYEEKGNDLLVFTRQAKHWSIVWRAIVPGGADV